MTRYSGRRSAWALLASAALCAATAGAAPPQLDIVGIGIGTGEADAIKALKKHKPDMALTRPDPVVFEALPGEPMRFWMTGASQSAGGRDRDDFNVILSGAPGASKVISVARSLRAGAQPLALTSLLAGLRAKYGPESEYRPMKGSTAGSIVWLFDDQGQPLTLGGVKPHSACSRVASALAYQDSSYRPFHNPDVLRQQLKPACGTMIVGQLSATATGNPDLVSAFSLSLLSNPAWRKSVDDLIAYLDAADDRLQARKEQEAAARGAPRL
jgi:hypothetical protein